MKITELSPPRTFVVGREVTVHIRHCANIELAADEQVTFVTESNGEFDVTRKSWGFYATPSLNGRLQKFGLRAVLVKNLDAKFYILLVESGKETDFQRYIDIDGITIVSWLDNDSEIACLEQKLKSAGKRKDGGHTSHSKK